MAVACVAKGVDQSFVAPLVVIASKTLIRSDTLIPTAHIFDSSKFRASVVIAGGAPLGAQPRRIFKGGYLRPLVLCGRMRQALEIVAKNFWTKILGRSRLPLIRPLAYLQKSINHERHDRKNGVSAKAKNRRHAGCSKNPAATGSGCLAG